MSALAMAGTRHAAAQAPSGRVWRIGWLNLVDTFKEPYALDFVQRLHELGFVEGQNLVIERRHADGQRERSPALAAELTRMGLDLIFTAGNEISAQVLKAAGGNTPIVVVAGDYDPVAAGLVASLSRPGGRITGVTQLQAVLPAKRLELLKEWLPALRKVAVFATEGTTGQMESLRAAAPRLGVTLHVVDFKSPPFDYVAAFAEAQRARADALIVLASGSFVPARQLLPQLALKAKLPSAFGQSQWADAGALMSYGVSFPDVYRRAADMVAKVLRGAKPSEMPVEQATIFELVLNLKTAKALNLAVPRALLVRADRLIE